MEKRNMSSQLKLQALTLTLTLTRTLTLSALRSQYEEQDRSCFTYKPEVGRTPRTASLQGSAARSRGPALGPKEPIHERLYEAHRAIAEIDSRDG
eukprot:scaffold29725_cov54-Phaeocystis_antarctica.AAC.2